MLCVAWPNWDGRRDSAVLANVRISDAHKDHQADPVVLMPESGVVVVEVKGGHVWVEGWIWFAWGKGTQLDVHGWLGKVLDVPK